MEVLPIRSELFVPENKRSAYVYKKDSAIVRDRSKEYQGRWITDGYQLDSKKNPVEIWIFYDNDKIPIDRRVLENNPLQGRWGYAPSVNVPSKAQPEDMWFFPPKSAKAKIPPEFEDYKHQGIWVKPTFKRDMSQLGSNQAGFLNISGEKRISRGEKHSVTGKWNMLAHNDDVVRGRKKSSSDDDDKKGTWTIYVRKPDKVTFPISVIPGNKITQCKKKIHEKRGIPIEDQRLFFNDVPLKDEKTVVGSGIQNGDTIDLGPMTVFVRTRTGKKFTFEVDPDEMVEDMKKMIEKREGTPPEKQRLYYNALKLMDGKPISHFKVRHKSTLDLGGMIIFVQPLGQKPKIELEVEPSDTLKSVKMKVKNRTRIPVAEQRLFFQEQEMKKDVGTLDSYNVQHLDTLFMGEDSGTRLDTEVNPASMIIFVIKDWDQYKFQLNVEPNHTILDVKKMIQASENILVLDQRLTFKKKSVKNIKTLEQANIKNRSILHLESRDLKNLAPAPNKNSIDKKPPQIDKKSHINPSEVSWSHDKPFQKQRTEKTSPAVVIRSPDGRIFPVPIDPDIDTIKDVKRKVGKKLGIPQNNVRLKPERQSTKDPKPLKNSHRPVDGDILEVMPPPIDIELPDKSNLSVSFHPDDTISDIKDEIERNTGTPKSKQRLFYLDSDDPELDNETPVTGPSFKPGKVLKLVIDDPPIVPITVRTPDGREFHLDPDPKDSISKIKDMIEQRTGTQKANQRLFFLDNDEPEINDGTLINSPDFKPGQILKLEIDPPLDQLELRTPGGRSFHLDIGPNDTINHLKEKAAKIAGVPMKDLHLLCGDKEINDDSCKPSKGDILDVAPIVDILLPDKRKVRIPLLPFMTAEDLMSAIKEKTGKSLPKQRLFFLDDEGFELPPKTVLSKAGVKNGSTIEVRPPDTFSVRTNGEKGPRTFNLDIDPDGTYRDVRNKVAKFAGIPASDMRLILDGKEIDDCYQPKHGDILDVAPWIEMVLPDKSKIQLTVLPTMTVEDVKELALEKTGATSAKHRVFFLDGSNELENKTPLSRTGIKCGSVLHMRPSDTVTVRGCSNCTPRTFHLDFEPGDSVNDLKRNLATILGVPAKEVHLVFDGEKIDEIDYRPSSGDILDIAPRVEVNMPDKTKIDLVVFPTMSVADAKQEIEERTGIPKAMQRIFYLDDEGMPLDDGVLLSKTGIDHGTVLEIRPPEVKEITLTCHDRNFVLVVDPLADTMDDLRRMAAAKLGFSAKELPPLFLGEHELVDHHCSPNHGDILDVDVPLTCVELPNGSRVQLAILPTHTIDEVKEIIEEQTGITKAEQRVFFFDSPGAELDDTIQLSTTEFKCGTTLKVHPPIGEELQIKVADTAGRVFTFVFDPCEPVKEVKKRLREKIGFPVGGLKLDNKKWQDDDDSGTFEEAGFDVRNCGILVAEPPEIEISLPNSLKIKVAILPTMTVGEIKKIVEETVPDVSVEQRQRMFFLDEDVELDDDTPFEKFKFEHGQVLQMRSILVTVQHWNGDSFKIDAETNWYIADLKERIFALSHIPAEQQRLLFQSRPVKENMQLLEQGIQNNSILVLEQMFVRVMVPSRKKPIKFSVDPVDTVKKLKRRALKKSGEQIDDPCLVLGGRELLDAQTLSKCMVQHDDLITLEVYTIYIMLWSGDVFSLAGVKRSDTVASLKMRIHEEKQIPKKEQRLSYEGRPLTDKKTLLRECIKHKTILVLEPLNVDLGIPDAEKKSLKKLRTKRFESDQVDEITPVMPDWKRRIFFFDNNDDADAFVQISIIHWTGYTFVLDKMLLSHKVAEIKERIFKLKGIKKKKQHLKHNGKLLDSKKSLREQDVTHKSVLVLESPTKNMISTPDLDRVSIGMLPAKLVRSIVLTVKHWKGSAFTVNAIGTEYIDDLKERIAILQSIPIEQQRLAFLGGPVLDDMTLMEQGIIDGSVLALEPMRVLVEMESRKKQLSLVVAMEDKIGTIKKVIATKVKGDTEDMCVMFGGEELNDTKQLSEYGVEHEDVLTVESFKISIMHWSGELFQVGGIHQSDTIHDLKKRIEGVKGVPHARQVLKLNGSVLKDLLRLKDQNVKHRSVIILQLPDGNFEAPVQGKMSFRFLNAGASSRGSSIFQESTITLKIEHWNGETFSIPAEPTEYLDDLKDRIYSMKQIPVEHQRLQFNGRPLQETNLKDQGIGDMSTLALCKIRVNIRVPNGNAIVVEVADDDTIQKLKKLVRSKTGIAIEDQCIVIAGEELDDDKTMSDYGIDDDDVLIMENFKVRIMDGTGETFEVDTIGHGDTVHHLKTRIWQVKSIAEEQQVLIFKGNTLKDSLRLKDQGVKHRSVLILDTPDDTALTPAAHKPAVRLSSSSIGGMNEFNDDVDTEDLSDGSSSENNSIPDDAVASSAPSKCSSMMKTKTDATVSKMMKQRTKTTTKNKKKSPLTTSTTAKNKNQAHQNWWEKSEGKKNAGPSKGSEVGKSDQNSIQSSKDKLKKKIKFVKRAKPVSIEET